MKFPKRFSFIKYKKNRFEYETEGVHVKIPSNDFPLNDKAEVFLKENTEILKNKEYINAIDEVEYKAGRCYQNSEQINRKLKSIGAKVEIYVGWLIIQDSLPTHHCWCVIDGKYIIDLADMMDNFYYNLMVNNIQCSSLDEFRELYLSYHEEAIKYKNSERCHLGAASLNNLYIGSKCSPGKGQEIFRKLISKNPNHPCLVKGTDRQGRTPMQRLLENNKLL